VFVGQWALAVQSAKIGCGQEGTPDTRSSILEDVVQRANDLGIMLGALAPADQEPSTHRIVRGTRMPASSVLAHPGATSGPPEVIDAS
jgi:hypothetical protein